MKNIIVLGGGTAGLISALMLKQTFPLRNVHVVESGTIGIIGVGEGSTEHWRKFADYCKIDLFRLVKETDGALKKGIKFENWNGDGKSYFHSLGDPFYSEYTSDFAHRILMMKALIINNIPTYDVLTDTNLVSINDGIHSVNQYHFNTFKLNAFLHTICKERGISFTDTTISDVVLKENGDVDYILGEDNTKYEADFFVDSTGFKRVISSKLGAKWVSYKKYLPMNHALAFPTESTADLKPYTLSRALSSGWNWRISTQSRYGNGYVFCDEFIDATKAHDEVQSFYSEEVKIAKDIKFDAGRVDKFWINNCVSVGLSASFLEPLEATSIGNTILQSVSLCQLLPAWEEDKSIAQKYDKKFIECYDNMVDFIQLHYITKRDDTEFWRALPSLMEKTDFIKEHLDIFKKTLPYESAFNGEFKMFQGSNWAQVMHGLDLYDKEHIKNTLLETVGQGIIDEELKRYNGYLERIENGHYINHSDLLYSNKFVNKVQLNKIIME
jgi:tryptophan halogenase